MSTSIARRVVDCAAVMADIPPLAHAVMGLLGWNLLPTGARLHKTLEDITDTPLLRRTMHTLNSGIGTDHSANIYSETADGQPVYDFTILDQILDLIATPRSIPFFGLSFMPEALTSGTHAQLTEPWMRLDRFPPKDYGRWYDFIFAVVRHAVERYGEAFVSQWYWDFWNEPDLQFYWLGTEDEFMKTYDYTAAAVRAALPGAKIGGPGTTDRRLPIFRAFLEHCTAGTNHVTGQRGAPLDFITFHVKGGPTGKLGNFNDPWAATDYERRQPSLRHILDGIRWAMETIAAVPGTAGLPVFITECDIDWGTGTSIYHNPNMHYRNSEYFAAFQCALFQQVLDVRAAFPANPIEATFLDTFWLPAGRLFEGQRTLITGDTIDKPILNALRLLGKLGRQRLAVSGDDGAPAHVMATRRADGSVQVMAVNFAEAFAYDQTCRVQIEVRGLGGGDWRGLHHRIDRDHSNAYTLWLAMGRPLHPTDEQMMAMQARMGLEPLEPAFTVRDGARLVTDLPPQSVSLWEIRQA